MTLNNVFGEENMSEKKFFLKRHSVVTFKETSGTQFVFSTKC